MTIPHPLTIHNHYKVGPLVKSWLISQLSIYLYIPSLVVTLIINQRSQLGGPTFYDNNRRSDSLNHPLLPCHDFSHNSLRFALRFGLEVVPEDFSASASDQACRPQWSGGLGIPEFDQQKLKLGGLVVGNFRWLPPIKFAMKRWTPGSKHSSQKNAQETTAIQWAVKSPMIVTLRTHAYGTSQSLAKLV